MDNEPLVTVYVLQKRLFKSFSLAQLATTAKHYYSALCYQPIQLNIVSFKQQSLANFSNSPHCGCCLSNLPNGVCSIKQICAFSYISCFQAGLVTESTTRSPTKKPWQAGAGDPQVMPKNSPKSNQTTPIQSLPSKEGKSKEQSRARSKSNQNQEQG